MHRQLCQSATVYLIRHALSSANADGKIVGGVDARVTDEGLEQAHLLAAHLGRHRAQLPQPLRLFSSDLPRAEQTSDIIGPAVGVLPEEIIRDPRLREIDRGDWEGRPRNVTYTPEVLAEIATFGMDHRSPNGESMNDVALRMRQWLLGLDEYIQRDGVRTFIAVTHCISTKALIQRVFGLHPGYAELIGIDNTSITKIRSTPQGWHLDYLNATPHLSRPL